MESLYVCIYGWMDIWICKDGYECIVYDSYGFSCELYQVIIKVYIREFLSNDEVVTYHLSTYGVKIRVYFFFHVCVCVHGDLIKFTY